jgi:hypothetical protein
VSGKPKTITIGIDRRSVMPRVPPKIAGRTKDLCERGLLPFIVLTDRERIAE